MTAGEESGLVGAKELDATLLTAKYGYAIDSDGKVGGIVTAAPFQAKLWTTITGKLPMLEYHLKKGFLLLHLLPNRFLL